MARQTCCSRCGHDVESVGRGRWHDRGGGEFCLTYQEKPGGEFIHPKGRHYVGKPFDPKKAQSHA